MKIKTTLACLLLFVAAVSRYWVHDWTEVVRHDPESVRLARSLAETGQFANPFVPLDTGPSAHTAPVLPALLALLMRVFGDGVTGMGPEVKGVFEELKGIVSPDLIFTHNRKDAHQDHRLLSELTWNTFRDHLILEYEIPKYDGDLGRPNVFIPLETETCERKISYIWDSFASQRSKSWFRQDTFLSLMRLRGMECNASSGYAEAFYCRKLVL